MTKRELDILPIVIDKFIKCIDLTEYKEEILFFKLLFLERINLKNIEDELGVSRTSVKNILKVIKEKLKLNELKLEIEIQIVGTINMDEVELKKPCITINTILSKEDVVLDVECESWEEAIRMAGEIMSNKVTLPHSKNNGNVFKSKMVLMNFRRDILFPEETPVKTMLTFTSQDENTHLDALSNFLDLVSNYKFLEKLENNPSKKKVIDIIKKYEFLSNLGKNRDIN